MRTLFRTMQPAKDRRSGFSLKTLWVIAHDFASTCGALTLAMVLRGEPPIQPAETEVQVIAVLSFALFAVLIYKFNSLYASRWRFASLSDLFGIFKAVTMLTGVMLMADYLVSPRVADAGKLIGGRTLVIYWCLQIIMLGGPRVLYRAFRNWRRSTAHQFDALAAVVVGRASDAEAVIRMAETGVAGPFRMYGIITPVPQEVNQSVRGVPVWGTVDHVDSLMQQASERGLMVQRAIIAPQALKDMHSLEGTIGHLRRLGIHVIRLDVAHSSQMDRPAQLHAVIDDDLLLRPLVEVDEEPLRDFVSGKRVIVTGGGGSIGSALALRSAEFGADRVLVLDYSETALHAILQRAELSDRDVASRVEGRLCDIRDRARIAKIMRDFKPDVVFHAAALKHLPHLEREVIDAVRTNVIGTINAADAAIAAGAEVFVMVSTDKATKPVSILGATKRMAEIYTQSLSSAPALVDDKKLRKTRLVSVRFGNVIGTAGSVVPRFRSQIEAGGPVTVTDAAMVRYFMTRREATDLLWTAARLTATQPRNGQSAVLVLNMGQPVRIDELAERMIRLAGLEPNQDIEIVYSGRRPGERLTEYLFEDTEPQFDIGVRGIVAARPSAPPLARVQAVAAELAAAADRDDPDAARELLGQLIPEFIPPKNVVKLDSASKVPPSGGA
jgi:O-antigen biosynthesis protein WbqV